MGKKVPDKKQAKAEARFAADDALTAVASCVRDYRTVAQALTHAGYVSSATGIFWFFAFADYSPLLEANGIESRPDLVLDGNMVVLFLALGRLTTGASRWWQQKTVRVTDGNWPSLVVGIAYCRVACVILGLLAFGEVLFFAWLGLSPRGTVFLATKACFVLAALACGLALYLIVLATRLPAKGRLIEAGIVREERDTSPIDSVSALVLGRLSIVVTSVSVASIAAKRGDLFEGGTGSCSFFPGKTQARAFCIGQGLLLVI